MKRLLFISAVIASIIACEKEPDSPPVNTLDQTKVITIDSIRAMADTTGATIFTITDSLTTFAIVTMDESSGNIYKNLYIQDHTGSVNVRMTSSSDYSVGDSLRVSLIGTTVSTYNGVVQLDNVDPDIALVRRSSGNEITPVSKEISDISVYDEGMLVQLNNVQFTASELANTYADGLNQSSENRIIEDCNGNNVIIRTSGFANYANEVIAQGNGSIVCIVNRFGSELQLVIRDPEEILMDGTRCAGQLLLKDFDDDNVTSGGWSTVQVDGPSVNWTTSTAGGAATPYGIISNFDSGNTQCENWLISPVLDLSASSTPNMQFNNAYNYSGDPLQLLVSTDYPGSGNPNAATWVDLSSQVTWSAGSWAWENSGSIDLSAYLAATVRIAFKYIGTNSDGSTWEIDDIIING